MRYCGNCGNPLPDGAKFCSKCGHPVVARPAPVQEGQTVERKEETPQKTEPTKMQTDPPKNTPQKMKKTASGKQPSKPSQKSRKPMIIGIIIVVILIATAVLFLPKVLSGNSEENTARTAQSTMEENVEDEEDEEGTDGAEEVSAEAAEETEEEKEEERTSSVDESYSKDLSPEDSSAETDAAAEHTYQVVRMNCTFEEAVAAAEEAGGYLAEIGDEEEYAVILAAIEASDCADCKVLYVGAAREDSYEYYWLSDEGGTVINEDSYWMTGHWMVVNGVTEPTFMENGMNISEDCLALYHYNDEWVFNDMSGDFAGDYETAPHQGKMGFIIEFEE